MLKFLYGFEYNILTSERPCTVSPILFNIVLYQVATKYRVPELKESAKGQVENILEFAWNSSEFLDAIREVYTRHPRDCEPLRRVLVKRSLQHMSDLSNIHAFQVLLDEIEGFAADIAREAGFDVRSILCFQQFERLSLTDGPATFNG